MLPRSVQRISRASIALVLMLSLFPWQHDALRVPLNPRQRTHQAAELHSGIVGFWHIGSDGTDQGRKNLSGIIRKQLQELKEFPIFGRVRIHFLEDPAAIDEKAMAALAEEPSLSPLHFPEEVLPYRDHQLYEFPTLWQLWSHCSSNPSDIVFYFHTKTRPSYRNFYQNNMFSDAGKVLEIMRNGTWVFGSTTCARRPSCHVPGNFWWARCDHVQRLNPPFDASWLEEDSTHFLDYPPRGRYMADYWILGDFRGPRPPHEGRKASKSTKDRCERPQRGNVCDKVVQSLDVFGLEWKAYMKGKNRSSIIAWP